MYQVCITSNPDDSTIYEFDSYGKAYYFAKKHRSIGARVIKRGKNLLKNLDFFASFEQPVRKQTRRNHVK